MSTPVVRESCGTFAGLKAHLLNSERPCSECLRNEAYRQVEHEGIPFRLPPAYPGTVQVTAEEAERNREILAEAIRAGRRRG